MLSLGLPPWSHVARCCPAARCLHSSGLDAWPCQCDIGSALLCPPPASLLLLPASVLPVGAPNPPSCAPLGLLKPKLILTMGWSLTRLTCFSVFLAHMFTHLCAQLYMHSLCFSCKTLVSDPRTDRGRPDSCCMLVKFTLPHHCCAFSTALFPPEVVVHTCADP